MTQHIMRLDSINRDKIIRLYQEKDYPISNGVNICGVRAIDQVSNRFDDVFVVFDKHTTMVVRGTTDPGLYYLKNPLSVNGCAIVPEGFHKDIWSRGLHKGKYSALVQTGNIRVIRDYNKDNLINYTIPQLATADNLDKTTYKDANRIYNQSNNQISKIVNFYHNNVKYVLQFGLFGINFHKASDKVDLAEVGQYSAGCQVVQRLVDYNKVIDFMYKDSAKRFSYALFNQDDYDRV